MRDRDVSCECQAAVIRAFGELRKKRMSEKAALESAAAVFRFHHPEVPASDAVATISLWVEQ